MKKQQLILSIGGLVVLLGLLFLGKTNQKKPSVRPANNPQAAGFNIEDQLKRSKISLNPTQASFVTKLEKEAEVETDNASKGKLYQQLASYWHDSAQNHELFVFYTNKAALLVNSEKNLTFAARLILAEARDESQPPIRIWKSDLAIELFEKAIAMNEENDSLKVELASCYVFGKGMAGMADETMRGVQQLLQVVRKDSSNMYAQMVLGIGGVLSTQYDKAISRLELVMKNEPKNLEAVSWLADAYAAKKDKVNAIKWYNYSKALVNNPSFSLEVDKRIKSLD